jgi:hypothetical protein
MFSLVRFVGRRLRSQKNAKRGWFSRAATVLAVLRYLDKKTSPPQRIVLKRNEKLEINVVRIKENAR